jgi:hypothetical protein
LLLVAFNATFIAFIPPLTDTVPADVVGKDIITVLDVLTDVIVIVPAVAALPVCIDLIAELNPLDAATRLDTPFYAISTPLM